MSKIAPHPNSKASKESILEEKETSSNSPHTSSSSHVHINKNEAEQSLKKKKQLHSKKKRNEDYEESLLLEQLDTCVNCVESVEQQRQYEEKLMATTAHGLTKEEAALIQLQLMEEKQMKNKIGKIDNVISNPYGTIIDTDYFCGIEPSLLWHCMSNPSGEKKAEDNKLMYSKSKSSSVAGVRSHVDANKCEVCFNRPEKVAETNANISGKRCFINSFAQLPCCGTKTKVCTVCMLLLTSPNKDGSARIGTCPYCRSWISITTHGLSSVEKKAIATSSSVTIQKIEKSGTCKICNQLKGHLVDEDGTVCDACFIGVRKPLLYECEKCRETQQIPHPMYRYQLSADLFGRTRWPCHSRCRPHFTKWRIVPSQIRFIPAGDVPDEWGQDRMALSRAKVMEACDAIVAVHGNKVPMEKKTRNDSCIIC